MAEMSEHIDGVNKCRMNVEGTRIRIDCYRDGEHVYGGLHPIELLSTTLAGVKK
ncbi:hypothetical protein RER_22880 [Rhodococcus erythropolis PR4]|uniref:Uncharacterized protein n=2 Tax=Rhodococcus erythropolis TaxID=1833 RepID=C0ZXB1_RHOE4|nr:hypothetical protein RER_22880 [Rhodococcus erythropolis PR4]